MYARDGSILRTISAAICSHSRRKLQLNSIERAFVLSKYLNSTGLNSSVFKRLCTLKSQKHSDSGASAVEMKGMFRGECCFVSECEITKTLRLLEGVEWLEWECINNKKKKE